MLRTLALLMVMLLCAGLAHAQDAASLARELVTAKGGYADKKRHLEEVRIRAYIPILLKAVGKGPEWKPGHPNWAETHRRIAEEWRQLYVDYLVRTGRDTSYVWIDDALAREYARTFNADELRELIIFYRTAGGGALLALEKEFLDFYPNDMLRSLTRMMTGTEALSAREQALLRAPENRARRDFVALFESEGILHEECIRISGTRDTSSYPVLQQSALATAADKIDALRRKVDASTLSELHAFLKSDTGRKERIFLSAAVPAVTPRQADPAQVSQEEAAFYKGLEQLSAQWREVAARPAAK